MKIQPNFIGLIYSKINEAEELLQLNELRHVHWKDWSSEIKAILTISEGRDDPVRIQFKNSCNEVDQLKDNETLCSMQKSDQRKTRLSKLIDILKQIYIEHLGQRVFLVHGRNEHRLNQTRDFLHEIGLQPIILKKETNEGRTIIEKFEENTSEISYAIVLLTGDDEGKLADSENPPQIRARQNVILELGYFIGQLGRRYVCSLCERGIELPSDFFGVAVIEFDEKELWKKQLKSEIEKVGFRITQPKNGLNCHKL